jgi:hypothetical protein
MEKRAAMGRPPEHARPRSYRGRMKILLKLIVSVSFIYNYQSIWCKDGSKNVSFSECSTDSTEFGSLCQVDTHMFLRNETDRFFPSDQEEVDNIETLRAMSGRVRVESHCVPDFLSIRRD